MCMYVLLQAARRSLLIIPIFTKKKVREMNIFSSLDGGWRGPAARHAGVGGVRPGPRPGGGQPAQQGLLGVQRGHA